MVEQLLSDLIGTPVRIVARELLAEARGRVERLSVDPPLPDVGSTLIAKGRALDRWSSVSLDTERAALLALDAAGVDLAPRVLASSKRDGVLVMTDVGDRTVDRILHEGDAGAARAALIELAKTTAALHRVRLDRALSPQTWTIGTHAIEPERLRAIVDELGFPSLRRARDDIAAVLDALLAPRAFAAFVHGDLTPTNAVIAPDGRCRLVDLEGAGRQHVGIDACMLRFPFAWYARWAPLPAAVQVAMEAAYRDALRRRADEIDEAVAVGCAAMTLVRLHRLALIDAADQEPAQRRRRRAQIVATLKIAIDAARRADTLPDLAAWLEDLLGEMRSRWPEGGLAPPPFPAFASDG